MTVQWRHNEPDGVSNHQPRDFLFSRLIRCRSKETSKLRDTGLCTGNSPVTDEFPAQMASNAEYVSIWLRHHGPNSLTHTYEQPSTCWRNLIPSPLFTDGHCELVSIIYYVEYLWWWKWRQFRFILARHNGGFISYYQMSCWILQYYTVDLPFNGSVTSKVNRRYFGPDNYRTGSIIRLQIEITMWKMTF